MYGERKYRVIQQQELSLVGHLTSYSLLMSLCIVVYLFLSKERNARRKCQDKPWTHSNSGRHTAIRRINHSSQRATSALVTHADSQPARHTKRRGTRAYITVNTLPTWPGYVQPCLGGSMVAVMDEIAVVVVVSLLLLLLVRLFSSIVDVIVSYLW